MKRDEHGLPPNSHRSPIAERPIRVVVFGGGPVLERGVKQFICRLEEHRAIGFLAAFCQPGKQGFSAVVRDLLKRRGWLGLPLLAVHVARTLGHILREPWLDLKVRRAMARLSDRIYSVQNLHHPEVLERVRSLTPDLGLIYGSPILKPELFEIPNLGTLGIHHGKAPQYRGKKTTFWAIYNGETTAAVTIQKVNAGLDTGEIVKQGEVTIGRRSYRSVCNELERLGIDLYVQAIVEVKEARATYSPQMGKRTKLYGDPKPADIIRFKWRQLKRRLTDSYTAKASSSGKDEIGLPTDESA